MTTNIFAELDREWMDLLATRSFRAELSAVGQRHPALVLLNESPTAPVWHSLDADAALHALLTDYAHGSFPAGRIVLQCMVPSMRTIARRSRRHYPDHAEVQSQTVAAMWRAIVHYNLSRTTRVATWLHGATWTHVAGDHAPHANGRRLSRTATICEVPIAPDVLVHIVDGEHASGSGHVLGVTGEVLELILAGCDAGVISSDDADLLVRFYVPDVPNPCSDKKPIHAHQARVALELGLSPAAARKRASRAARKLAEYVYLQVL